MSCNIPNRVVRASAACKNSSVEIALSLSLSTGTSTKLFFRVSKNVPPGGIAGAAMVVLGLEEINKILCVRTGEEPQNQTAYVQGAQVCGRSVLRDLGEWWFEMAWDGACGADRPLSGGAFTRSRSLHDLHLHLRPSHNIRPSLSEHMAADAHMIDLALECGLSTTLTPPKPH